MNNPYMILGVAVTATHEDIKNAFRALSKIYHPDAGTCANPDHFNRISDARDLLLDAKRRKDFDQTGNTEQGDSNLDKGTRATGLVIQAIQAAAEADNPWIDIDTAAKTSLRNAKAQLKIVITKVTASLARLELVHSKMTPKTSSVSRGIAIRIEELRKHKKKGEDELVIVTEAELLLAEHRFESHTDGPSCTGGMALPWSGHHL